MTGQPVTPLIPSLTVTLTQAAGLTLSITHTLQYLFVLNYFCSTNNNFLHFTRKF